MSGSNFNCLSSGDELYIDEINEETPVKAVKKKSNTRKRPIIESDEEDQIVKITKKPAEHSWQTAMDIAVALLQPLKVDIKNLTLLCDVGTLECFRKACQVWLNEKKIHVNLTFSTQKSFTILMGRFLFDFVIKKSNMKTGLNLTSCVIWKHNCLEDNLLKCLHGSAMINKEHIIEMDVASENGQKALKENPEKTKITTNKWGKNIVQIKNSDAACCFYDANSPSGMFNTKSCGLFYSESKKALQAFKQIMAFQKATYPKMKNADTHLLMPIKCECNYFGGAPFQGRQMCKITPFTLTASGSFDESSYTLNASLLASINNPAVLVFQCCNPVFRATKASSQRNCDFKISAPDVIGALQLAKQLWISVFKEPPPVCVPEFKWLPCYQYQHSILPSVYGDTDDALF